MPVSLPHSLSSIRTTTDRPALRSLSTAFGSNTTNRYVIIALAALSFILLATVFGLLGWIWVLKRKHRSTGTTMLELASPMYPRHKSFQQPMSQPVPLPHRISFSEVDHHPYGTRSLKDAPFPIAPNTHKEPSPFSKPQPHTKGRKKIRPSLVIDLGRPLKRNSQPLPTAPWTSPLPPDTSSSSNTVFRPYRTVRAASYPPDTRSPLQTPNSESLLLEQRSNASTPPSKIVTLPRRPQTAPTHIIVTDTEASTSDGVMSPPFGLESPEPQKAPSRPYRSPPLSEIMSTSSSGHRPTTAGSGRPTTAGSNAFSIISATSWSSARYSYLFFKPRTAPPGSEEAAVSAH